MRSPVLRLAAISLVFITAAFAYAQDGTQRFASLGVCKLVSGRQIGHCRLGYRTWGRLNAQRSNAILFPTWFAGRSSDLASLVGSKALIDPARYFFIAVDSLGDGVSSSPSNSGTQHGPAFPAFTTRDMVNAEYRLVTETLRLRHLHAVMGLSMGGMQTFEWMVDYPGFMTRAIAIAGTPRLTGSDLLLWRTEEEAFKADPAWRDGKYQHSPPLGLVQAIHTMNLTTAADYARAHPPEKFAGEYAGYFTKGIQPFDANDWRAQLEAMMHHDVAHGGTLKDAAKKVRAKVLVIAATQDRMVNPQPAIDFAALLGARTMLLHSACGHLSFGCEAAQTYPAVRAFLDGQ